MVTSMFSSAAPSDIIIATREGSVTGSARRGSASSRMVPRTAAPITARKSSVGSPGGSGGMLQG